MGGESDKKGSESPNRVKEEEVQAQDVSDKNEEADADKEESKNSDDNKNEEESSD